MYKPPSGARPPSNTSEKVTSGDLPLVLLYSIMDSKLPHFSSISFMNSKILYKLEINSSLTDPEIITTGTVS